MWSNSSVRLSTESFCQNLNWALNTLSTNWRFCRFFWPPWFGQISFNNRKWSFTLTTKQLCQLSFQGVGFTRVAKELTTKFDDLETRLGIISWFGRVASHSNLADGPSRLRFDSALLSGAIRKSLKLPQHISELGDGFG